MKDFKGKVAVITGAASGIGRAVAEFCVQEGMKVVLADVEEAALTRTVNDLQAGGAVALLPVVTDVSKWVEVEALAQKTMAEYGAVHFLFNNAGVGAQGGPIWENSLADWEWVMGVNLWGEIHVIRAFVPLMLKQESESHIVNTASVAGLVCYTNIGVYNVTKYGIVALSETLHRDLLALNAKIKVSVLCPGVVNTRLGEADRNRPAKFQNPAAEITRPEPEQSQASSSQPVASEMPPAKLAYEVLSSSEVAAEVFRAVRDDKFYILTHPKETKPRIQRRMEDILAERIPAQMFFGQQLAE